MGPMARSRIAVDERGDAVVFTLPRRIGQAGRGSQIGVGILLLVGAMSIFGGCRTLFEGAGDQLVVAAVTGGIGVLILVGAAIWLLSQARIEVTSDAICCIERIGPLDRRHCFERATLRRLLVVKPFLVHRRGTFEGASSWLELRAHGASGVRMARFYRQRLLRELAELVAARIGFAFRDEFEDIDEVIEFRAPDDDGVVLTDQQLQGGATVQFAEHGLVMTVPKKGLGSGATLSLTIFMAVLFPAGFAYLAATMAEELAWTAWFPGMIAVLGAALCLGLLVHCLRSWQIRIQDGDLSLHRIGAFWGEHVHVIPFGEVTDIVLIDCRGDRPGTTVKQLQIKARYKTRKLLKGRDEVELEWIRATLLEELETARARKSAQKGE